MKRILLGLFIAVLPIILSKRSFAGISGKGDSVLSQAYITTDVDASSGQIFVGIGYVKGVYYSSEAAGTAAATPDWWILLETNVVQQSQTYANFSSATKRSPAVVFSTAPAANGAGIIYNFDFGDPVIFTTGCFLYKTLPNSGEAIKAVVKWRR